MPDSDALSGRASPLPRDLDDSESPTGPESLEPVEESATLRRIRAVMWPDRVRGDRDWH